MDHAKRDESARSFRGPHFQRRNTSNFPGLDLDGWTLDEVRRKVRGENSADLKRPEGEEDAHA